MNVKGIMNGDVVGAKNINWGIKEDCECYSDSESSSIGTLSEDSMDSICSSSSELLNDEQASSPSLTSYFSSTSSSSLSHDSNNGPLYELQELMDHLPIKRGLSMFYQGKTQSFTSLANVQSLEDLPKKDMSYSKRMKSCKSFGGGLDHRQRMSFTPKATISKTTRRGSFMSLQSKRGSFLGGSRPVPALYKNF